MSKAKSEDPLALLRKRVLKMSTGPGVYRWLKEDGSVLYVGKAKNLRARMQTYVQKAVKHSPWTEIMVRQIHDFEVTVVHSELEAFILESTLIKELKPKYNIMLKDDKGYVYVRVSRERYPRIEVVRQLLQDNAKYFGPFMRAKYTSQTLDMLDSILKFRACRKSLDTLNADKSLRSGTPCLDYQIGKCSGLCIGLLSEAEYRERIDEVVSFFRGNFAPIKRKAIMQMQAAATEKKFEKAARIRDSLRFIEDLEKRQVVFDTSPENADIFGIALRHPPEGGRTGGKIQAVLLRQREGKLIEQVGFPLRGEAENASEALAQFLPQYYAETQDIPDTIILAEAIEEATLLETWLRERKGTIVRIIVPERGKKSKLLLLAQKNAEEKVEQQFAAWESEQQKVEGALQELATLLTLPGPPRRIEGFDISHLGGSATVGSMVAFVNGKPKREHYRSFNMRTVQEGAIDDFKSLKEVLKRRLKYLTDDLPTDIARFKKKGIVIGKARKVEQKRLEEILASEPALSTEGIRYQDFVVARIGDNIIGCARLIQNPGNILEVKSVWVEKEHRGQKLGQLLVRVLLSKLKKGKAYVLFDPSPGLEEYYNEIGFRYVQTPPDILRQKTENFHKEHPEHPVGTILVFDTVHNKPDASFLDHPDLLLIDGGKPQLSAALSALEDLKLSIPVAALAKREEEIFLPGHPVSLRVPEGSPARFLLQRIRDEAHRFANDRRERRLESSLMHSILDEVPGIGEATKKALLKKFGSVDAVLAASDTDLLKALNALQLEAFRKYMAR